MDANDPKLGDLFSCIFNPCALSSKSLRDVAIQSTTQGETAAASMLGCARPGSENDVNGDVILNLTR